MGLLVVGIPDVGDGNEDFERILLVGFSDATFYVAFDFCFTFFAVASWCIEDGIPPIPYDMLLTL